MALGLDPCNTNSRTRRKYMSIHVRGTLTFEFEFPTDLLGTLAKE